MDFFKIPDGMKQEIRRPEEFGIFLEKFSRSIRASILKFGLDRRGIDPEDAMQEVRLRIWKKFASEKKIRHPTSYIKTVVNSTLTDCLRKSRSHEKVIQQERQRSLAEAANRRATSFDTDNSLLWETIGEAADTLIDSRRQAVKLFLLNLSIEEIAQSLNWTEDKTRNLIYRGLADIRQKLKEKGIEYEHR